MSRGRSRAGEGAGISGGMDSIDLSTLRVCIEPASGGRGHACRGYNIMKGVYMRERSIHEGEGSVLVGG